MLCSHGKKGKEVALQNDLGGWYTSYDIANYENHDRDVDSSSKWEMEPKTIVTVVSVVLGLSSTCNNGYLCGEVICEFVHAMTVEKCCFKTSLVS